MGFTPASGLGWLAWGLLAPLWGLLLKTRSPEAGRRPSPQGHLLLGALWGLGYNGVALSWILGLHPLTWMGLSWNTSVMVALACWVAVTLWGAIVPTLWAVLFGWLGPKLTWVGRLWLGATLWCGLEWLMTHSPLWWPTLAYTQSPHNGAILHLGRLAGQGLIGAVLLGVNGGLAETWLAQRSLRGRAGWRHHELWDWRSPWLWTLLLLLVAHGVGFGLSRQSLPSVAETPLRVGVIQGRIPTREKLSPAGIERAIAAYTDGIRELASQPNPAEAVLMPEGALPFPWTARSPQVQDLTRRIQQQGVVAWVGTFMPQGEAHITQSLITVTPTDSILSRYNKVKLVPLGEYLPFEPILGQWVGRLTTLAYGMVPGSATQRFETPWGPAAVVICYDSAFPALVRHQVAGGATFILSVANNDPYSGRMMAQHHAHDVMRAIESDRWLVRATNTGYSGVIDPHGRTVWRSQRGIYETHLATIDRRETQTLYMRWGDWFLGVQGILSLGLLVRRHR
jgi:apolipoprotein N-acyltransferase